MGRTKPRSNESERMFTYEEYMREYAPKNDDTGDADDNAEVVAKAMADETLAILKAGLANA